MQENDDSEKKTEEVLKNSKEEYCPSPPPSRHLLSFILRLISMAQDLSPAQDSFSLKTCLSYAVKVLPRVSLNCTVYSITVYMGLTEAQQRKQVASAKPKDNFFNAVLVVFKRLQILLLFLECMAYFCCDG